MVVEGNGIVDALKARLVELETSFQERFPTTRRLNRRTVYRHHDKGSTCEKMEDDLRHGYRLGQSTRRLLGAWEDGSASNPNIHCPLVDGNLAFHDLALRGTQTQVAWA
jgi:hypothetical protein